jgi:uncharacterized protein involved in oxidation of intracellular sulfur
LKGNPHRLHYLPKAKKRAPVNILFIINTAEGETIYNAMRLANTAVQKGDDVAVFMLGLGVCFEQSGGEAFDVMGEIDKFEGDFFV